MSKLLSPHDCFKGILFLLASRVFLAGFKNSVVVVCTRGEFEAEAMFGDIRKCNNQFYCYAVPYFWLLPKERVETGASVFIAETRRAPSVDINQRAKSYNRADLTAALFEALDHGADSAVLCTTRGTLSEGFGFNIWLIKDGTLLTPDEDLLEGMTRRSVFELAETIGGDANVAELWPHDLETADEAFLSTTASGIVPITKVGDRELGNGAPGLLTCSIRDLYWKKREAGWHGTPVAELLEHDSN